MRLWCLADHDPNAYKVIDELHIYLRHTVQLWVQWFTFFQTVNYVALGWFASEIPKGGLNDRTALYEVTALFVSQNILGIVLCFAARTWISNREKDLKARYSHLGVVPPDFGQNFSAFATFLGALALIIAAVIWIVFAIHPQQ